MNHPQHSGQTQKSSGTPTDIKIWAEKTIVFNQNDDSFNSEIFSSVAETAANVCCPKNKDKNKPAQIRLFYDELTSWDDRVRREGYDFKNCLPYIRMLRAKLAYAKGRKLIDQNFYDIFSTCIEKINDTESLHHCKLFLEAFIGFRKALDE